jgi:hypothetical protein
MSTFTGRANAWAVDGQEWSRGGMDAVIPPKLAEAQGKGPGYWGVTWYPKGSPELWEFEESEQKLYWQEGVGSVSHSGGG